MDDEDSSIQRGLGQPIQKMNEQAGTWNKVLGTGQEIPKVQKDPYRCIEKKLRNRYHARGSDDQGRSMSVVSAETNALLDTMKLADWTTLYSRTLGLHKCD